MSSAMYSSMTVHVAHQPDIVLSPRPVLNSGGRHTLNIGRAHEAQHISLYGSIDELRTFITELAWAVGLDTSPHRPTPARRLYLEHNSGAA